MTPLEQYAQFLDTCAAGAKRQIEFWQEHLAMLETAAKHVRTTGLKLEPQPAPKPEAKKTDLAPWKTPITETHGITFDDLGKEPQPPKKLEQPRGIGIYPHETIPEAERTYDNTRRRLHQLAGYIWFDAGSDERHQKLRDFASDVLEQTVLHISQLHRKDAWKVCQELEAHYEEVIGVPI